MLNSNVENVLLKSKSELKSLYDNYLNQISSARSANDSNIKNILK